MVDEAADAIVAALEGCKPTPWMVALVGIPGAGKSTVAGAVAGRMRGSVVVPMDGYHRPRALLSADEMARRGAPDTFDPVALRDDLIGLRASGSGTFPAFDHAAKDPRPDAIAVPKGARMVIVEGLYLLLRSWRLVDLFDFVVYLDCPLETALSRVASRHLRCGLEPTAEAARLRADTNDRRNALIILDDHCRDRADLVVPSEGATRP